MSVITLRGLSPQAEKKLRGSATANGKSINRFLIDLIEDKLLGSKTGKPQEYDDLDHIIGKMTPEDVLCVEESVVEQRKIDDELWS